MRTADELQRQQHKYHQNQLLTVSRQERLIQASVSINIDENLTVLLDGIDRGCSLQVSCSSDHSWVSKYVCMRKDPIGVQNDCIAV